jgi:hypothetical protein
MGRGETLGDSMIKTNWIMVEKRTKSHIHAENAIAYIKANPNKRAKQICEAVGITIPQFQNAIVYIKRHCERIRLEWRIRENT